MQIINLYHNNKPTSSGLSLKQLSYLLLALVTYLIINTSFALYKNFKYHKNNNYLEETLATLDTVLIKKQKEIPEINTEAKLQKELLKIKAEQKSLQENLDKISNIKQLNSSGFSRYFNALSNAVLPGLWLIDFTIDVDNNKALIINGQAINAELISAFINKINQDPAFAQHKIALLTIQPITERTQETNFNRFTNTKNKNNLPTNNAITISSADGKTTRINTIYFTLKSED